MSVLACIKASNQLHFIYFTYKCTNKLFNSNKRCKKKKQEKFLMLRNKIYTIFLDLSRFAKYTFSINKQLQLPIT